jgi:hypothetical protein
MAGVDDLDAVLEQFKQAGNEFVKGHPKPVQDMFSHKEDVSLANPFGPRVRGWGYSSPPTASMTRWTHAIGSIEPACSIL